MIHYYDKDGSPISQDLWAYLFQDASYIRVARTVLHLGPAGASASNKASISTVWLGLDHNIANCLLHGGPPLIFETMIFHPEGHLNEEQYRYSTEEEALAHHAELVTFILLTHALEPAK